VFRPPLSLAFPEEVPRLAALIAGRSAAIEQGRGLVAAAIDHGVVEYVVRAVLERRVLLAGAERHHLLALRAEQQASAAVRRRELPDVLAAVAGAIGTPPLLIKGPVLAQLVYPDPQLRPFGDLDLVVPADRLADARHALERELGYQRAPEPWPGFGERHGHHAALWREGAGHTVHVELHWRIGDDPAAKRLDYDRLAAHAERLHLAGREAWVPGSSEHLLVLSVHLLHEANKRLMWIHDIGLLAGGLTAQEWEATSRLAHELGLGWVLQRALDYATTHLANPPPVRERLTEPPPAFGPLRVSERLDGWIGRQAGRVALGGWARRDGYLRSAVRARRQALLRALRHRLL
jgi:hypothetical protein